MKYISFAIIIAIFCAFTSCKPGKHTLPIEGPVMLAGNDTIYHTIPDFTLTNQNGKTIRNEDVAGKVYVADFFFVSCPTICRDMAKNMQTVYEKFGHNPQFAILSHTIDPMHDSVARLKRYAEKLKAQEPWHFLRTEDPRTMYNLGQKGYKVTATEQENEMGDYLHDGSFILVDQQGRIRGYYDGTKPEEVAQLIMDIPILLKG